jgi:electron transfer flavoprotein alpha/beta subunit
VKIIVCLQTPRGATAQAPLALDDAHALAMALALGPEHTVTALLAGLSADEAPLRRALAAGATRAVRVVGEDFGVADFHTLGQALGTAVRRLGADLVLTGARSDDDGLGAVPAAVARQVGALHVACIESLSVAEGAGVDVDVRGGGRRRRLRLSLPAVLSVVASRPAWPALPDAASTAPRSEAEPAAPNKVEVLSLVDPEATVVRRRTELLGQPELPQRATLEVNSAEAFVAALSAELSAAPSR